MAFTEKPPILRGTEQEQLRALRDYLFRMAQSLEAAAETDMAAERAVTVKADGTRVYSAKRDIEAVRQNAKELQALIIKSAEEVERRMDRKVEEFESSYVARSELYGTYTENIQASFESTARGVVESYDYESAIRSTQDSIDLIQDYVTQIDGEIRRGIVEDPETHEYVTGIAISQRLRFSGECGQTDVHNPGDGYTYYYIDTGQTFGLYTSTGWQFWIDGHKRGWFDSLDGMLHVAKILVESTLRIGDSWQITSSAGEFEIMYVGS